MIAAQFKNWWISSKPKVKVQSAILRKVDDGEVERSKVFFVGEKVRIVTTLQRRVADKMSEMFHQTLSNIYVCVKFKDMTTNKLNVSTKVTNIVCKVEKDVGFSIFADTIVPDISSGNVQIQVTLSLPSCTSLNLTVSNRSVSHLAKEEVVLRNFMRDAAGAFANVNLQSKIVTISPIRTLKPVRVHSVHFVRVSSTRSICSIILESSYNCPVEIYNVRCVRPNGMLQIENFKKPVRMLPYERQSFELETFAEDFENVFVRWGTEHFLPNEFIEIFEKTRQKSPRSDSKKCDVLIELSLPQSAKLHETVVVTVCVTNMSGTVLKDAILSSSECENASWMCLSPRIKLSKLSCGVSERFELRFVKLCEEHSHETNPISFLAVDSTERKLVCDLNFT